MAQVLDAPWIREAENDGVGYEEPTEQEYRSSIYQDCIADELMKIVRDLECISGVLDGLPDGTVWDKTIQELNDAVTDLCFRFDNAKEEVERW